MLGLWFMQLSTLASDNQLQEKVTHINKQKHQNPSNNKVTSTLMPHINLIAQRANNKPPVAKKSLGQRITLTVKWPRVIPYLIH